MDLNVISVDYHEASLPVKNQIKQFLQSIWPDEANLEPHRQELKVQSFFIMNNNQIISYGAIIKMITIINGVTYQIGGLSCIATLPEFRKQGLSSLLVKTATAWMKENLDFGVFTCKPELQNFYCCNGNWQVASRIVLKANHDQDALSSDKLDVVVLVKLFSNQAKKAEEIIMNSIIYLGFSKGQFI